MAVLLQYAAQMRARIDQMATTCLSTKAIDAAERLVAKYGVVPVSVMTLSALTVCTPLLVVLLVLAVPVALISGFLASFMLVPTFAAAAVAWYMFPSVRELDAVRALTDKAGASAASLKSYGHTIPLLILSKLQGKPTNGAEREAVDTEEQKGDDMVVPEVVPAEADAAAGVVEEKVDEAPKATEKVEDNVFLVEGAMEEEEVEDVKAVPVDDAPIATTDETNDERVEEAVVEKEAPVVDDAAPSPVVVSDDDLQAPSPAPTTKELSPSTSPAHPSCVSDGGSPTAGAAANDMDVVVTSDDPTPSMPLLNKAEIVTPSSSTWDLEPAEPTGLELDHEVVAAEVTEFAKTLAAKNAGSAEGASSPTGSSKRKKKSKKKKGSNRSKSPPRATA